MANMCVGSTHFPFKVHVILERGYDCIQWCGPNCFRLTDASDFVANVLPKFFKHEKLSSFTRQLNIYGFHKIREGPLKGAYTHEDFMRGDLERVSSIPRTKRSGSREVMKARESRNASVIYSSMMMHNDDDRASCPSASASDYSSDSSGNASAYSTCNVDRNSAATTYVAPPIDNKRKRSDVVNEQPNLFAILEKTRFAFKERSYEELKAENAKKMKFTPQVVKTENQTFPSPSPEFESDFSEDFSESDFSSDEFNDMPFEISYAPRSISKMSESGEDVVDVDIDVLVDVLDVCQSEVDFNLFNEGANTSAFSNPQFSTCCW